MAAYHRLAPWRTPSIEWRFLRLGAAYERASLALYAEQTPPRWAALAAAEAAAVQLIREADTAAYPFWSGPYLVRGRNAVRRWRNLEPLQV